MPIQKAPTSLALEVDPESMQELSTASRAQRRRRVPDIGAEDRPSPGEPRQRKRAGGAMRRKCVVPLDAHMSAPQVFARARGRTAEKARVARARVTAHPSGTSGGVCACARCLDPARIQAHVQCAHLQMRCCAAMARSRGANTHRFSEDCKLARKYAPLGQRTLVGCRLVAVLVEMGWPRSTGIEAGDDALGRTKVPYWRDAL